MSAGQADDLMDADVTSSGAGAFVIDVRDAEAPPVTRTAPASTVSDAVQRTSEWSADDSSYYLG